MRQGGEEEGCSWVGQRVSELMTVLSAGAERTEMERASVFSTMVRQAKSPCAKQN